MTDACEPIASESEGELVAARRALQEALGAVTKARARLPASLAAEFSQLGYGDEWCKMVSCTLETTAITVILPLFAEAARRAEDQVQRDHQALVELLKGEGL